MNWQLPGNSFAWLPPTPPMGVLWQNSPLEWVYLRAQAKKVVASYPGLIATLILKGRKWSIELFGKEPSEIVFPYNKE